MEKVIIAQFSIKKTETQVFLKLAESLINKTLSENGCLTYKLLKEVNKENEFFFYEKYKNQKAIESHNLSEHFNSFINSVKPILMKEPIIDIF